ncbi:MAG: hypothetical protein AB1744_11875, partial [Candidatus Zixiibacteriota bacterium]
LLTYILIHVSAVNDRELRLLLTDDQSDEVKKTVRHPSLKFREEWVVENAQDPGVGSIPLSSIKKLQVL